MIGDFGFYRVFELLLKMRTAFRYIATKSGAHTPTGWGAEHQCKMQKAKLRYNKEDVTIVGIGGLGYLKINP